MGATAERMRANKKGKRSGKLLKYEFSGSPFTAFRRDLANSPEYDSLSGYAVKIFNALLGKYDGSNNGDLSLPYPEIQSRFKFAKPTISKALKELEDKGFIVKTRQGYKSVCNLYLLTCFKKNEIKFLNQKATSKANDEWNKSTNHTS